MLVLLVLRKPVRFIVVRPIHHLHLLPATPNERGLSLFLVHYYLTQGTWLYVNLLLPKISITVLFFVLLPKIKGAYFIIYHLGFYIVNNTIINNKVLFHCSCLIINIASHLFHVFLNVLSYFTSIFSDKIKCHLYYTIQLFYNDNSFHITLPFVDCIIIKTKYQRLRTEENQNPNLK